MKEIEEAAKYDDEFNPTEETLSELSNGLEEVNTDEVHE